MIHYRKSGMREFYKVDGHIITRVWNKKYFSRIDISDNKLISEDAMEEKNQDITEEEFTSAYKEALERITTGKI